MINPLSNWNVFQEKENLPPTGIEPAIQAMSNNRSTTAWTERSLFWIKGNELHIEKRGGLVTRISRFIRLHFLERGGATADLKKIWEALLPTKTPPEGDKHQLLTTLCNELLFPKPVETPPVAVPLNQEPVVTPPAAPPPPRAPTSPKSPKKSPYKDIYDLCLPRARTTDAVQTTTYTPPPQASEKLPEDWETQLLSGLANQRLLTARRVAIHMNKSALPEKNQRLVNVRQAAIHMKEGTLWFTPLELLQEAVASGWKNWLPETTSNPEICRKIQREAERWVRYVLEGTSVDNDCLAFAIQLGALTDLADPTPEEMKTGGITVCHGNLISCFFKLITPRCLEECMVYFRVKQLEDAIDSRMVATQKDLPPNLHDTNAQPLSDARANATHYFSWFVNARPPYNPYYLPQIRDSAAGAIAKITPWCGKQQGEVATLFTTYLQDISRLIEFCAAPKILSALLQEQDFIPPTEGVSNPMLSAYVLQKGGFLTGFERLVEALDKA